MKVYVRTEREDRSLRRIINALIQYAPDDVKITEDKRSADLILIHVIGRCNRTFRAAQRLVKNGQKYAVAQYSVRRTRDPQTSDWLPLWRGAVLIWSYYDLKAMCAKDWTPFDFRFYHSPLGVDSSVFWPRYIERPFVIGTCGPGALTESIREAAIATKRVERTMFHLGPELKRGADIVCQQGMDDEALAYRLNQCEFVAALRRTEGFEMMAAEGLLCGARPICFDQPHYRQWYGPWAVFIPETSRGGIIDNLEAVFRKGAQPVMDDEIAAARKLFDWETIVTGFWREVLDGCKD